MKGFLRWAAGGCLATMVLISTVPAFAGIQDFYIHNNSKWAIFFIHVSPDYSSEWEEDVLGADVLMPGEALEIEMNNFENHCYFDIRIEDERENIREYRDIDLCSVVDVNFP